MCPKSVINCNYKLCFLRFDCPASLVSSAKRFFQMNCSNVTSQSSLCTLNDIRCSWEAHRKFVCIHPGGPIPAGDISASLASVITAKKARWEERREGGDAEPSVVFFERSTCEFPRGRSHCSGDFVANERATRRRDGKKKGRMSPRAFVARVWISSRLLSSLECLLYDERGERYSCCRDSPSRRQVHCRSQSLPR